MCLSPAHHHPHPRRRPAQRAQEQYDAALRIADRLAAQLAKSRSETRRLEKEHEAAVRRRDYLREHPDLPKQKSTTTTATSGGTTA